MKLSKKRNCLFNKHVSRSCQGTTMVVATANAAVKRLLFLNHLVWYPLSVPNSFIFRKC